MENSAQASWDDIFNEHKFKNQEVQLMKNFNIHYECLDAHGNYHAQLKNGIDKSSIGSWEDFKDEDGHEMESFYKEYP